MLSRPVDRLARVAAMLSLASAILLPVLLLAARSADPAARVVTGGLLAAFLLLVGSRLWNLPAPGTDRGEASIDELTEGLAAMVRQQWRAEESLRRLQDPAPIGVRWRTAAVLQDQWVNITGDGSPQVELEGDITELADVLEFIPSRRLVILGQPGAGKTVFSLRLSLDLLERRTAGEPVPLLVPIGGWDPRRTGLRELLIGRLLADYPGLGARGPAGGNAAERLVHADRIFPILDSMDEVAPARRPTVLLALNTALGSGTGVVVTCRPEEYERAVAEADVLTAAAVIEISPLTIDDLASYLPRTTRAQGSSTKWDPVLQHIRTHGTDRRAAGLRAVLDTPLMAMLARTAYSDTPADPARLLHDDRLAGRPAVVAHLLDQLIPALYPDPAPDGSAQWQRTQTDGWFRFLARHLDALDTADFAWWQLHRSLPAAVAGGMVGCVSGGATGAAATLAVGPWTGLGCGAVAAVAGGIVGRVLPATPSNVRLSFRHALRRARTWRPRIQLAGSGTAARLGWPTAIAVLIAVLVLAAGPPAGAFGAVAVAVAFALDAWLDVPSDPRAAASPISLLRADRRAALVRGGSRGVLIGAGTAIASEPTVGVALGLAATAISISLTAWGRFEVARLYWAATGRLPVRLLAFLADAHRRGMLRQTGGTYQFRHLLVRERLVTAESPAGSEPVDAGGPDGNGPAADGVRPGAGQRPGSVEGADVTLLPVTPAVAIGIRATGARARSAPRSTPVGVRPAPPTFGILTAMPVEFVAMKALLDAAAPTQTRDDQAHYWTGELPSRRNGHRHRIVLAQCGETGTNAAADATTNMIRSFGSVSCVIMAGVAAGIPDPANPDRHVRLGDIVAATRGVVDYDHVTQFTDVTELRRAFPRPAPILCRAADELIAAELDGRRPWEQWLDSPRDATLAGFDRPAEATDRLSADPYGQPRQHPSRAASGHRAGRPKVHYGTIGSGDRALRSAQVRDELARRHGLRALEMEGAGVGKSAHLNGRQWFMVRGVSDYGDDTHSRTWRRYAAFVAGAYVRALLGACEPVDGG